MPHPASPIPPVVLKLGGALLADASALDAVWTGVRELRDRGVPVVVVHGGGPQQTEIARRLGHEPRIVAGRRVTTDLDLQIALWALRGELNARLVGAGVAAGVSAVGLSGADGGTVRVHRRPPVAVEPAGSGQAPETVDFGHVGDVEAVDPRVLRVLLEAGTVVVLASVCADAAGALFNVNADTVAMEVAVAVGASRLELVTQAGGVRRDAPDPASHLPSLDAAAVRAGVAEGWIAGGMRPKLDTALAALARGVPSVRICDAAGLSDPGAGTTVVP